VADADALLDQAPPEGRLRPSPQALPMWRVRSLAVVAIAFVLLLPIPLALLAVGVPAALIGLAVLVGLLIVAMLVGLRMARIRYEYSSYRVGDRQIEVRRGALFRTELTIPYHRVQHVDVSAGPLEQLFGLRSLTLVTAASTISGAIAGIEPHEADRVRAVVLARIGQGDAV
jgi:membrane protein YdbS with pleckstrin-like domain